MDVALQQVRDQDSEKEKQAKHYAVMRYHTKDRAIAVKDNVLFERKRERASCLPRMRVNLMK